MSQTSPPAAPRWRPSWLHGWLLGLVLLPCLWIWADPHTMAASEAMLATPLSYTMAVVAGPFGKLDNQLAVLLGFFLAAWVWRGRRRAWQWLAVTLLCLLATGIVVNVTKVTVGRPRPTREQAVGTLGRTGEPVRPPPRTSFPSADVASVLAIAMGTLAFAPRASVLVFVVGGMVGEARLCAGVHHFADVWGSVLISTATSAWVVRAWRRRQGASACDGEGEPSRASPEVAEVTSPAAPRLRTPQARAGQHEPMTLTITTTSPDGTRDLGRGLAPALREGDVVALHGDLGAGKTVLVQGLADGLQAVGRVTSPTFVIMRRHPSGSPDPAPVLYHVDAYRLTGGNDLLDMGLDDWLADGAVAVEWADNVAEALPPDHLAIHFTPDGDRRTLSVTAHGPRARELLAHLRRCGY